MYSSRIIRNIAHRQRLIADRSPAIGNELLAEPPTRF
jgi:hypothetical protein